ncbi:MAG: putative Ig domain-containing protein [Verrucomicrobiales bacterium]|nr:putative Ig domain-containing protein [Verrucomicrobiales bacterium]
MPFNLRTELGLLGVFFFLLPSHDTRSADITWIAPAGGNWNVAANWSPPQVPGPSDHAHLAPPGASTITLNADAQVAQLTLGDGTDSPVLVVPIAARRLSVSGELAILAKATLRHGGILTNGAIRVAGELAWTGGVLGGSSANPLLLEILEGGRLSLTNVGAGTRNLDGAIVRNGGIARWTTGTLRTSGAPSVFTNTLSGRFEIADGRQWSSLNGGSLEIFNQGDLIGLPGSAPIRLDGHLSNHGSVQVQGTLSLNASSGRYRQFAGRTILTGGTLQADGGLFFEGGLLEGLGALSGPVQNGGTLRPGSSPGDLKVNGSLDLTPQSLLDLEIAGSTLGAFDRIQVTGRTRLAGAVRVSFLDGFTPALGNTIDFLNSAGGLSGRFDHFSFPAGLPWLDLQEYSEGARFVAFENLSSLVLRLEAPSTLPITAEQRLKLPVTLWLSEGNVDEVTLTATAQDSVLVPSANLTFTGVGRARYLTLVPDLNRFGATVVTVTATAPSGATASASIELQIAPTPVQGLQAYEPFDYPSDGVLTSAATGSSPNGSVGFSRAWYGSSIIRVERSSLPHPDLLVSGHHASTDLRTTIQSALRDLSIPIGTSGTTRYLSFLARADRLPVVGPNQPFFGILLDTSVNPDFFIGKPGQGAPTHWVIEDAGGAGQQASLATIALGEATLVVAKLEFEDGNDRVSLFIAPSPGGLEPATPDAVRNDRDLGSVRTLALQSTDAWSVDEVRVGTTWNSVVPHVAAVAPLVLQPIADVIAEEETSVAGLRVSLAGSVAPRVPVFELTQAPAGMNLNAATGLITWRPDESQGGQTFDVTVQVRDTPEPPARVATTRFRATVLEQNNPPQLTVDPLANLRATRGAPFRLKLGARDNDVPENSFTFEKTETAPAGLTLSPAGDLEWTPPIDASLGRVIVGVRVTDFNPLAPEATRSLSRVNNINLELVDSNADLLVEVLADGDFLESTDSIPEGATGVFHFRVANRGPSSAPDVQLALRSQLLNNNPPQVEFVSGQPSQGTCVRELDAVLCRFGDLAPNATADCRVTLRFRLQGQASFDLQANSAVPDLGFGNHRRPIEIRVTAPAPSNPDDWEFTEIENLGVTGHQVIMQPDQYSKVHMAWFNPSERTLRHAIPAGDDWFVRTIQTEVAPPAGMYRDAAGRVADALVDHQNLAMVFAAEDERFLFVSASPAGSTRLALKSLSSRVKPTDPEFFTVDEGQDSDQLGSPVLLGIGSAAFVFYRKDDELLRADIHLDVIETDIDIPFYEFSHPPAPVPLAGWRLTRRGNAITALNTETLVISAAASDGLVRLVAVRDQRANGGSVIVTPIDVIAENDQALLHHSMAQVGGKLAVAYERHLAGTDELWLAEWDGLTWHRERIPMDPTGSRFCARPTLATGEYPEVAAVCTEQSLEGNRRRWIRSWRVARRVQGVWQSEELFRSESVIEPIADGNPPPIVEQPSSPGVAYLGANELRSFAAHTGWPAENLNYARRRPRWDVTSLAPSTPGVAVGSPAIALASRQPSVAWSTTVSSQSWRLNRAKRVNGLPESSERTVFVSLDDPSGTAGSLREPLTPGSYLLGTGGEEPVWGLLNADPATQQLQYWRIREGMLPESPDLEWLPIAVPDNLRAAPGGSELLTSDQTADAWIAGLDRDRLPAVMRVDTDAEPPTFSSSTPNTVSPRTARLVRVAFVRGNPFSLQDTVYAVYFAGGPPYSLRVAEFRDQQWTRDVQVEDVTDNFVGAQAIPLATDELPGLAVDWAIHPPSDAANAPGWLYVAYPHGLPAGEQTLRLVRVDLSSSDFSIEPVDLLRVPSPLRSLKGLRLRTVRESLRLAYTDGGHLYLGRCNGILDLSAVRDMTFETLPVSEPVSEVDLAFDGSDTWLATRGTNQIIVSGAGRFPRTDVALSGDLYTPSPRAPTQEEICVATYGYFLAEAFRGPVSIGSQSPTPSSRAAVHRVRPWTQSTADSAAKSDLTALRAVRDLMLGTPEGQRLEALYRQFSPDAAAVLAANPKLLVDALATVRNFLPGMVAYASGSGGRSLITRGMIDQLNNLWGGLANHGSPALKGALIAERDRFHGFEDFVGRTFDQWAELLRFPTTSPSNGSLRIVASERVAAGFVVSVEAMTHTTFRLERADRVADPKAWVPVANATINTEAGRVRLMDPAPPAGPTFYRVAALPSSPALPGQSR